MKQAKQRGETFTYCNQVNGITRKGFFLGHGAPQWSRESDVFIPRSMIRECDSELDDIQLGDEIIIEIPLWLAREKGLAE